jgi:RND superfamily putative drug exporter
MKSRIVQDEPQRSPQGEEDLSTRRTQRNLAARAAHWSANHRKMAIWGWLGIVFLLFTTFMAGQALEQKQISRVDRFSGESHQAERVLTDAGLRPTEEVALLQSQDLEASDPQFKSLIAETATKLTATEHVDNVATPYDGNGGAISDDGHSVLVDFDIAGKDTDSAKNVTESEDTMDALAAAHPEFNVEQFGSGSSEKDLQASFQSDLGKAGLISLPLTLIILAIALGGLVAAGVPLLLALTGVIATLAMIVIPSQVLPLDSNVAPLILLIGLAVGVDYSLFYMRREREERASGKSPNESLETAAATSGRAVMISAITVIIAMSGMFITGEATFESFAVATVAVVAVEMLVSLLVLPAVLAWLGDRVENGHIPFTRRPRATGESGMWSSIVRRVMRRPLISAALATAVLVALAIPALSMNMVQTGTDDLSRDLPVMQTYDRYTAAFPEKTNASEVVVEAGDVRSGEGAAAVDRLVSSAKESDVVNGPIEIDYSDDGKVADVTIPTIGDGTGPESIRALDTIRDELVPAAVADTGVEANVTGNTAGSEDFKQVLQDRMPLVFLFVLGLAFVLLLVTFRSIVIPIKAIILNLLSVGAAYGVLVWVFQDGHGESLLGFNSNGGVTNWLPVFLFVILFGLSMDYHVFILSRVRELYDRGMSSDDAVREGISRTAGVVTSAATVMVAVFLVFATLSFIDFKQMGVGLAVAILIDATIIRGVLLPATMKLLGDWNWYLPRSLEWLPRVGRPDRGRSALQPRSAQV